MVTSLKNEKLRKWLSARKGRTALLAKMMKMKKTDLYRLVIENRLQYDVYESISEKQKEILELETECIKKYRYLNRFYRRGNGRIPRLAEELRMNTNSVRRLLNASGDSRFRLIEIGMNKVLNAIKRVEKQYSRYCNENVNLTIYTTREMKRRTYDLLGIENVAAEVRDNSNAGENDAAVIFRKVGQDRYRIIAVGFDYRTDDMCKSHVCDKKRNYMHAITVAGFSVPRNEDFGTDEVMVFSTTAPCPKCAERILKRGVSAVYCYFEPDDWSGLELLKQHGVPVFKINVENRQIININSELIEQVA